MQAFSAVLVGLIGAGVFFDGLIETVRWRANRLGHSPGAFVILIGLIILFAAGKLGGIF